MSLSESDWQELVAVIEESIWQTSTGLEAANVAADQLEQRGWRKIDMP